MNLACHKKDFVIDVLIPYLEPILKTLAELFRRLYFTAKKFETHLTLGLLQFTASQLMNIKFQLLSQNMEKFDSFRKTVKISLFITDKLWTPCWGIMSKCTITGSFCGTEAVEAVKTVDE